MNIRDNITEKIKEILKENDVEKASLFGSILRKNFNKNSDIDILIKFKGKKTLFDLVELKEELSSKLNRRIDLLTYDAIHPLLKQKIINNQIRIL